jgi:hypothetical protein
MEIWNIREGAMESNVEREQVTDKLTYQVKMNFLHLVSIHVRVPSQCVNV